ncbi:MAG: HEPN domain-containing protein [Anaerolineales bacterium]|nr:HEPN domain-containing protein [Anaerolineales bacterium]
MTPEIEALLEKSQQSLQAAETLQAANYFNFAASRLYYAMFYVAQALLLSRGLSYSSHSAIIAGYGREFAKK